MKSIFPYIHILRPLNLLFSGISIFITAYLIDALHMKNEIWRALLTVLCFAGAANILNDLLDYRIDLKNKPDRPLPSGIISKRTAIIYMILLYLFGGVSVMKLPTTAIIIVFVLVLPLLVLYTPIFKRIPLMGNMVIGGILGSVFLFAEAALTGTINVMWTPAWLAFGLTLIRELIKDAEDIEGDKVDQARTFPAVFGISKTLYLTYSLIIIFCVIWWQPFIDQTYGIPYAICLFFLVEIPLILSIFFLRKNPTSLGCAVISQATKWITFGGMITILCSKF